MNYALKRYCSDQNVLDKIQHYDRIDTQVGDELSSVANGGRPVDRRRSSSLCRITGMSRSLDEPHYFPSKSDFPYFGRRSSCTITMGHEVLGNDFHFPVLNPKIMKQTNEQVVMTKLTVDFADNPGQLLKQKFKRRSFNNREDYMNSRHSRQGEATSTSSSSSDKHEHVDNGHVAANDSVEKRSSSSTFSSLNGKHQNIDSVNASGSVKERPSAIVDVNNNEICDSSNVIME